MERVVIPSSKYDGSLRVNKRLFWTKIISGIAFGFSSYFVTRFTELPWYVLIPIFFVPTLIISVFTIRRTVGNETETAMQNLMKTALRYSGSWLMAYLAFATIAYFVGW